MARDSDVKTVKSLTLQPTLLSLPVISDARGSLGFAECGTHIPFSVKRVYYLFDITEGAARGAHAHKHCIRIIVALSGSVTALLDDGHENVSIILDSPATGLHIPGGLWLDLKEFAPSTVLLAIASETYSEDDYIRDYGAFLDYASAQAKTD